MTIEELLTLLELAERLKVKKTWVYNQTRKTGPDSIPRLRCGKYLRFRYSEVLEWLQNRN